MNGEDERQQAPQSAQPMYQYAATDEISLIELINVVLKNRRLVVVVPAIVFILVVGNTFLQKRTYTASASFTPQTSSGQRSLTANLAAQFGFALPGGGASQSPQFYADLLKSREILRPLVESIYVFESGGVQFQATIPELLEIENEDPARVREVTLRTLGGLISVSTNRETGLVSFSVKTWWAELSSHICQDLLDQLNRFNLETRRSQASAEREFVESRLDVVRDSLRVAEDALEGWLKGNRLWQGEPELEFVHDRLQREVTMRQQIYTSVNQAHEQARIDEVRDTPVITLVERPEPPVFPDRRRLLLKGIFALMVGAILGVFGAFGREFMQRGRQQEGDEFAEYERLKRETLQDLRRPWRLFRR